MGIKRSECSDEEWGAKLVKAYDAAAACAEHSDDPNHPRHAVNAWLAAARGSPVSANDAAPAVRRTWGAASPEVVAALDAGFAGGRSASDALAVARAHLRHTGFSDRDGRMGELESYVASATSPRVNASETVVAGYDRLR